MHPRTAPQRIRRAAPAALALLAAGPALLWAAPTPSSAQGAPPAVAITAVREEHLRTIAVSGEGSVEATPDRAAVTLGVTVVRPTAQDAQAGTAAAMDGIVRRIASLGISTERIHTAAVSLVPQRKPGEPQGPITGYEASNRVTVTVDDLRLLGRVIDAGVGAGANTVEGVSFTLKDPAPYRTRALRLAVGNAQATAAALAAAAGVGPIRLISLAEIGPVVQPRFVITAAMAPGTPILPGTVNVTMTVRAVYVF